MLIAHANKSCGVKSEVSTSFGVMTTPLARRRSEVLNHNLPAERDKRPVSELVNVAAQHSGADGAAQLISKLHEHGVEWAWQLECADHNDWAAYGASHGLRLAVRAELKNPSVVKTVAAQTDYMENDRLRRFLLIPDADGNEPPPMREMSSLFLSLLLVAPAHRQGLLTRCFKLLGLVSGLLMVPASIMLNEFGGGDELPDESIGVWSRRPTAGDVKSAIIAGIFAADVMNAFISVLGSLMVSATGWRGSVHYYELLLPVLGFAFGNLVWGVCIPLLVIIFWKTFDDASSPYPALAALFFCLLFFFAGVDKMWQYNLRAVPLEIYHKPRFELFLLRLLQPWLASLFSEKHLLPAARKRAAELRLLAGIDVPVDGSRPAVGVPAKSRVAPA